MSEDVVVLFTDLAVEVSSVFGRAGGRTAGRSRLMFADDSARETIREK